MKRSVERQLECAEKEERGAIEKGKDRCREWAKRSAKKEERGKHCQIK